MISLAITLFVIGTLFPFMTPASFRIGTSDAYDIGVRIISAAVIVTALRFILFVNGWHP